MMMHSWKAALGGALIGVATIAQPPSPLFAQTNEEPPVQQPAAPGAPMTPEQIDQMVNQCATMMRMMAGMMNQNMPGMMPGGGSPQTPGMMPGGGSPQTPGMMPGGGNPEAPGMMGR
jgi:hypothetical protein